MSKEELQKCSKEYLIKIIDDISRENIKIIDENQAIKNIKYTVEETIYKTRWNSLREWLEKVVKLTANIDEKMTCKNALDKMNELESGDKK